MRDPGGIRVARPLAVFLLIWHFSFTAQGNAQAFRVTVMDSVRAMQLDSMEDMNTVYFRAPDRERASALRSMLHEFTDFWSSQYGVTSSIRLAVLRPDDWERITTFPYGFPHYFALPANLMPAAALPPRAVGLDTLLVKGSDDLRDWLLIGHEGGHLLTWSMLPAVIKDSASGNLAWLTVPVAKRGDLTSVSAGLSPAVRPQFERIAAVPQWYWEYAATLFMLHFLSESHPTAAAAYRAYFDAPVTAGSPRFTHLDDWFGELMRARMDDGAPYFLTQSGGANFVWYHGAVARLVSHVLRSASGTVALSHIRRMVSDEAAPVTSSAIISELEKIAPGARALLEHVGASPGVPGR
jgi:hypothetical protein